MSQKHYAVARGDAAKQPIPNHSDAVHEECGLESVSAELTRNAEASPSVEH